MGELLTQVWLKSIKKWVSYLIKKWIHKKRVWRKTSGVHASSRMPTKKCAMKMKQRNKERRSKRRARKNAFGGRKPFIRRTQRNWGKRSKQASSQRFWTQWRYHLFSKRVNWCQGGWFFERGRTNGAIKLAMAGTQDRWRRFSPLLDYWFYIVRTCWVLDN